MASNISAPIFLCTLFGLVRRLILHQVHYDGLDDAILETAKNFLINGYNFITIFLAFVILIII